MYKKLSLESLVFHEILVKVLNATNSATVVSRLTGTTQGEGHTFGQLVPYSLIFFTNVSIPDDELIAKT